MDDFAEDGTDRLTPELVHRLETLRGEVPPSELGDIWVFPPLDEPEGTREFLLFTRLTGMGPRRLYTARVPRENGANGNGRPGPEQVVDEHGRVPAGRVPRLVTRFLDRLGENQEPLHLPVNGSEDRWQEILGEAPGTDGSNGAPARQIEGADRDR